MNPFFAFEEALLTSVDALLDGIAPPSHSRRAEPPPPADGEVVISSVGYACEHARGSVTALLSRPAAHALYPFELDGSPELADCDVLGEMTNMIVGRMKNLLLARGVVLMLGTPMSTVGRTVRLLTSHKPTTTSVWYTFEHSRGRLGIRLDASFDPAFQIEDVSKDARATAGVEGDMLFF